jgi:beta propeller repeat protein/parallel beta-helix repeat protein
MGTRIAFLLSVIMVVSGLSIPTDSSGTAEPGFPAAAGAPVSGVVLKQYDWNVTSEEAFVNATIYLTGNLTVQSAGVLRFANTTLAINLGYNGQFKITVDGLFTMDDLDGNSSTQSDASRIVSNITSFKYAMTVRSNSKTFFNNSVILHAGYDSLNPGISVLSNAANFDGMLFQNCRYGISLKASGSKVVNSSFKSCYIGVYSYFCNPVLRNLTVTDCTAIGMYLFYSTPVLSNCLLERNRIGISLQNSNPDIIECTVANSSSIGVNVQQSSPLLVDCALANALDMDVAQGSFPDLLNTTLNESTVRVALGQHVSVGRHLEARVVNQTGAPCQDVYVAVIDSEGNAASCGTTDQDGTAFNLAYRERYITREGTIEMDSHRLLAFSSDGMNTTFGENSTAELAGTVPVVVTEANPPDVEIWQNGETISDSRLLSSKKLIALGSLTVTTGGSLQLEDSQFMSFSSGTGTISCVSGGLDIRRSTVSAIGAARRLAPSALYISVDSASTLNVEDSGFRWLSEFRLRSLSTQISNTSIDHASVSGIRIENCAPAITGLRIDWAPRGLSLTGDSSAISGMDIGRSSEYGIYASQSSAGIECSSITDSAIGVYSYGGNMAFSEVGIRDCDYGIFGYNSDFNIADSSFSRLAVAGLQFIDSGLSLDGGTVTDCGNGLITQGATTAWVEGANFTGNGIGLKVEGCAPVLLNCSMADSLEVEVGRGSSAALVNCSFDHGKTTVSVSGYIDIGDWTDVLVINETGWPVPGCNVSVRDSLDQVSASGVTGSGGTATDMAFRQKRVYWNRTEEYGTHTITAFGGADGAFRAENSVQLQPGGLAIAQAGANASGWILWPTYKTIDKTLTFSNNNIVAYSGVLINGNADLVLEDSTLWFFGKPKSQTVMDVSYGGFSMYGSRLMPLSALAPLQSQRIWLTYRLNSRGELQDSEVRGMNQITAYSSNLAIRRSTVSDMAGTGLHIQACSPEVSDALFLRCHDGLWSSLGSPLVSNTSAIECADNGIYAGGGAPKFNDIHTTHNTRGFYLADGTEAVLSDCETSGNDDGFYVVSASPTIVGSEASGCANSGLSLQKSRAVVEGFESSGSTYGVYCSESWPTVSNSYIHGNSNGIRAYKSAPYLYNCTIDGNGIGLSIAEDVVGIKTTAFSSGAAEEHATFVNGGTRVHISVTLPSRALVRQASLTLRGDEIGNDAVIADGYSQFSPAIHGDWLVWQDFRNEDWDIYAYNLSVDSDGNGIPNYLETPQLENDPALLRITDNPFMQGEPDIYDGNIVWTDYRNGNPDIYAYSLSNSTEWAVCTLASAQSRPAIDGDRIVWQDYRNGNYDICLMNISDGSTAILTTDPNNDMSPEMNGNFVVWYSYYGSPPSNDYSDIHMFDLKSWTLTNVNKDSPVQYTPDIYGNNIVWHDNRNGNWEIYTCDVETLAPRRLTWDPEAQQNFMPRIFEQNVVFYFHNRVTDVWSVRMANITTGVMTVLEQETYGDAVPTIYGNRVAWVNRTGNRNDIHVLDFGLPGHPRDVSLDVNIDGTPEFRQDGELHGAVSINGSWLAEEFGRNLGKETPGTTDVPISVSANGTGRVILGPVSVTYDLPTYILGTRIVNSSQTGVVCTHSSPAFINSTFLDNPVDFTMGSGASPRTVNSTFSESKLIFQDRYSNLTVQNYLHVRAMNLTSAPLDVAVTIEDNGFAATAGPTGADGVLEWCVVTDARYNQTGRWENATRVSVLMDSNIFADNPRAVDMAVSHWEIFTTDSVGPVAENPFPPPGWTFGGLRPVISIVITDDLGIQYSTVRLYVQSFMVFYDSVPVPGGYNVSYQHPMDFADGSVVRCRLYCADIHGNILDYAWEFKIDTRAEQFVIEMSQGWNLISLPFETYNTSVESVLWSIGGSYDLVRTYTSVGQWLGFRPGRAPDLNTLASMNRKIGYWIHATENCTLRISGVREASTGILLHAGWNLVGYPALAGKTVANAFWGTGADRVEVEDAESPYLISEAASTYVMKPGQGFWVHVPFDAVWVVDW